MLLFIKRFFRNGYVLGGCATAAILAFLHAFLPVFGRSPPELLFLAAISLAVWQGGFSAGLFTTALSLLASAYFLMEPFHALSIVEYSEKLRLLFLAGTGSLLSLMVALLRRAERRALQVVLEREERLRAESAERRALEEKLEKIVATVPVVICSFRLKPDGTACLPYASPAIKDIYDIRPEDLAESADPVFALVHPDDLESLLASIMQSAHAMRPWRHEWRVWHPTKGEIWMEGHSLPEREPDGAILWHGYIHDVTLQKQIEDKLRRQAEQLREAARRKDEFLAMLGHELRNPLTPIRNAVQIMRKLGVSDPKTEWARDVIDRQVAHLVRLVDDLLDVSRIVQGKLMLKKAPMDIAGVVDQAVEAARPFIDARRHSLTVSLPQEPLRLEGDDARLVQVVSNLLDNAAKYTPEGGRIRLAVPRENGTALISVRDTGEGIAAALLPCLFDVFTQAERTLDRAQGGLGLGLTVVEKIVDMHGGRVEARSEGPGKGSEFLVRLPLNGH
jgi:signal transduction histidine kinase